MSKNFPADDKLISKETLQEVSTRVNEVKKRLNGYINFLRKNIK